MRSTPEYIAAIVELAAQCSSGSYPDFELENQAAAIGSQFGVDDAEVRRDVADAQDAA